MTVDPTRRKFLRNAAGLAVSGIVLAPGSAFGDRASVDIGNWSTDIALEWLRNRGNDVIDLRGPGWNDVGSDALIVRGPDRGPVELKGTVRASGAIAYRTNYRGWYDTSRSFDQREPAYAVDRLYKVSVGHPSAIARHEARQMLVDAARGDLNYSRIEMHGVGGLSPRVRLAGQSPLRVGHLTEAFGSPRPIFANMLDGLQLVGRGLFYIAIVADAVGGVERFMEVEEDFDRGRVDSKQRELLHAESVFRRAGTWAAAYGGAKVGGLLAAALMTNPGGWAILGALGIVGLSAAAGALIGGWSFGNLGVLVIRAVQEMGGSLSSLIEVGAPVIQVLHATIDRCKRAASSVFVAARDIARAMWDAVIHAVTVQPNGPWLQPALPV